MKSTPLFYACKSGNKAMVKYLVKHGVKINKHNKYDFSPLFYAFLSGNRALIKYSVKQGADLKNIFKISSYSLIKTINWFSI